MQLLQALYKEAFGRAPQSLECLPAAGSNRRYVRMQNTDGGSIIGVIGPNTDENRCFVYLSRHFAQRGLPVPKIAAVSADATRYLQTDLGRTSLYDALSEGRTSPGGYSDADIELVRRTLRLLPHLQVTGAEALDETRLLSPTRFTAQAALFDLNYFKYCFLRTTDLGIDEVRLDHDFHKLSEDLAGRGECQTFLYRDFQARNVMLLSEQEGFPPSLPHFIDFQGGQLGPMQYDLASFLWQASARYPQILREAMLDEYLDELSSLITLDEEAFRHRLDLFVLFRILQVLGAYGLRGYFERKKYFIDSIPPALQNLRRQLIDGICTPYPYLHETLERLVDLPRFNATPICHGEKSVSEYDGSERLIVRIFSFSYKKGIPADTSGNGGGYVFDCRSTHNPGRYDRYKALTGLDEPVIRFLEDDGEILTFLDSVYRLADMHVARYMERGFTDLMFAFGCTGGRHRSVYSAEHLAEHLHEKFGIEIRLCHREQGIERTLPSK